MSRQAPETSPRSEPPRAQRAHLAAWIESATARFDDAARASGTIVRRILLAGAPVEVRYAGAALSEQLGPALDHATDESADEPALVVSAWDSAGSGVHAPLLPAADAAAPRGAVLYSTDGVRHVAYQPGLGQLSAYDAACRHAWFWCEDATRLPFWEPAAPFRQILHWWLPERGAQLLHGAAVGAETGGVLLVGRGGSGKSTCALASLTSPLLYAGDDYVAVEAASQPQVHSLYCSGKLEPGHARLLAHLPPPSFDGSEDEKAVFYVRDRFPDRMCRGFPLVAVVAPRVVAGPETRFSRVQPARALAALAPSTLLQLVPARAEALTAMAALLRRLPTYALEVGGPVDRIPAALERLLREAAP